MTMGHTEQSLIVRLRGLLADLASPKTLAQQEKLLEDAAAVEAALDVCRNRWRPRWRASGFAECNASLMDRI